MTTAKAANTEPIPGYRLIELLGSGGFGEVWKCEAPGGLFKAVKFVHGDGDDIHPTGPSGAQQELRALQHIKGLRHPFLLSMDRVEVVGGELVIVMELADRSLHDLLCDYRGAGRPGVPRAELLRYFVETAEVLDLLNEEHGLQHLDIKPRNLFLVGRHVKVADFGLVNSVAELSGSTPSALQLGAATPVYASPESFLGKITPFSDQYSLAIAYHELLVGEPPFAGKNFRQLALQHMQAEPDLRRLPEADRPVVARALAKEPGSRFPSCTAFVQALEAGAVEEAALPPAAAHRPAKTATLADVSIVSLTTTPGGAHGAPAVPRTHAEIVLDTRTVPPLARAAPDRSATGLGVSGDPLAAWQFRECVARNPAGETWAARNPDGRDRLVRFFFGVSFGADGKEDERLVRLRALRHDALEPMELVGGGEHRLALITDACSTSLASRMQECQAAGLPGIPRAELLDRLGEAAAALDELFESYGLHHLGLAPRCLTLRGGRLRLLNFGLAELIHLPAGQQLAALNPRYSAPELFEGRVHESSDVYSLALIYCELLTGVHPFRSHSQRQMATPRLRGQPDLSLMPGPDRDVLQCALHADPGLRFTTCGDFVAALDGGGPSSVSAPSRSMSTVPGATADPTITPTTRSLMRQAINGLVAAAAGGLEVREYRNLRCLLRPGRSLEHQFFARLASGVAALKLEAFRQRWQAELKPCGERSFLVQVTLSGAVWQRLLGLQPALKLHVDLAAPVGPAASLTEVQVRIEPVRCGRDEAARLLEHSAPELLESLRTFLQALPERRNQARLSFEQTVRVAPTLDDETMGDAVVSRAKDISLRGMGLYMPCRPPSLLLHIYLPGALPDQEVAIPACVVRALPHDDGYYEVGVRFLVEEGPPRSDS